MQDFDKSLPIVCQLIISDDLKWNLKLKYEIEIFSWYLKFDIDIWNLKLNFDIKIGIWNSKLNFELENRN